MHHRIVPLVVLNVVLIIIIAVVGFRISQEYSTISKNAHTVEQSPSTSGFVKISVVNPDTQARSSQNSTDYNQSGGSS